MAPWQLVPMGVLFSHTARRSWGHAGEERPGTCAWRSGVGTPVTSESPQGHTRALTPPSAWLALSRCPYLDRSLHLPSTVPSQVPLTPCLSGLETDQLDRALESRPCAGHEGKQRRDLLCQEKGHEHGWQEEAACARQHTVGEPWQDTPGSTVRSEKEGREVWGRVLVLPGDRPDLRTEEEWPAPPPRSL